MKNTIVAVSVVLVQLRQKVDRYGFPPNLIDAVQPKGLRIMLVSGRPSAYWIGLSLEN
jgi:hypothetical protein